MILMSLLLLVLVLAFVLWPALAKPSGEVSRQAENLRLYRERQQEIRDTDYDDEQQEQMLLELDRELLESEAQDNRASDVSRNHRLMFAGMVTILILIIAFAGYQHYGAQDELRVTALLNKSAQSTLTQAETDELAEGLAIVAGRNPENAEWQYLHARYLLSAGRYADAINAFTAVIDILPDEAVQDKSAAMVQRSQARFYAAQQVADVAMYEELLAALELNPQHRQGMGLAGMMAHELKDYRAALEHWKALWISMAGSREAGPLAEGIRRVAKKLEDQGETVDLSWLKQTGIKVNVSVSEALSANLKPDYIVFVMARAGEERMPLAAVRLLASELPTEVVLDDSASMMPGVTISQIPEVTVVARVAKGGSPVASSGDLEGMIKSVKVDSPETVKLTIDRIIP